MNECMNEWDNIISHLQTGYSIQLIWGVNENKESNCKYSFMVFCLFLDKINSRVIVSFKILKLNHLIQAIVNNYAVVYY